MVDDIIDVTEAAGVAGKETAVDMQVSVTLVIRAVGTYVYMCVYVYSWTSSQLGFATAPILFASEEFPELHAIIARKFTQPGDVEKAKALLVRSRGIERARDLARSECDMVRRSCLPLTSAH